MSLDRFIGLPIQPLFSYVSERALCLNVCVYVCSVKNPIQKQAPA